MKVIIAGSRDLPHDEKSFKLLLAAVRASGFDITTVICGMANGADKLGWKYAMVKNLEIIEMPANWNVYGKAAGPIRNRRMADAADAAIVLWDGTSPGSKNMIKEMQTQHKPCYTVLT